MGTNFIPTHVYGNDINKNEPLYSPLRTTAASFTAYQTPQPQVPSAFNMLSYQYPTPPSDNDFDRSNTSTNASSMSSYSYQTTPSSVEVHSNDDDDEEDEAENEAPCDLPQATPKIRRQSRRRSRTTFTKSQLETLERTFDRSHYPEVKLVDYLCDTLRLSTERVSIWFQNRRARYKKMRKAAQTQQNQTNQIVRPPTQSVTTVQEPLRDGTVPSQQPVTQDFQWYPWQSCNQPVDSPTQQFNYTTSTYPSYPMMPVSHLPISPYSPIDTLQRSYYTDIQQASSPLPLYPAYHDNSHHSHSTSPYEC